MVKKMVDNRSGKIVSVFCRDGCYGKDSFLKGPWGSGQEGGCHFFFWKD